MYKTGHMVIEPGFYKAGAFGEGLAPACDFGDCGLIDKKGEFEIPPSFSMQKDFPKDWRCLQKVKAVFYENDSGLRSAAQNGDILSVRAWLQKGADLNARNDLGLTALTVAELMQHANVVDLLKKAG